MVSKFTVLSASILLMKNEVGGYSSVATCALVKMDGAERSSLTLDAAVRIPSVHVPAIPIRTTRVTRAAWVTGYIRGRALGTRMETTEHSHYVQPICVGCAAERSVIGVTCDVSVSNDCEVTALDVFDALPTGECECNCT